MKKVIIGMIILIAYAGMIYGEEMTVEKLINRVKQNVNRINDLRGNVEITYKIVGKELKQTMEIWYKKPNKFKLIAISSTGVPTMSSASDGLNAYDKSKILYYEDKIRKYKPCKGNDYFPFKVNYYFDYDTMFEIILKGSNPLLTKISDFEYKIETQVVETNKKNEVWIDYEKGLIMGYNILFKNRRYRSEIKESVRYGVVNFPVNIKNETFNVGIDINLRTEILWKDVRINGGIKDKEFIIE